MKKNNKNRIDTNIFLSGESANHVNDCILEPGTKLLEGRFVIDSHLETGSTSHLYRCKDLHRKENVVLKIFTDNGQMAEDNWTPACNEAKMYASVPNTEHIICTYDFHICTYGGAELFLIPMEFADGGTLRTWLCQNADRVQVRQEHACDFIRQICLGLKTLHDNGYFHLDLKPENLVFCGNKLKIIDLGTAAYMKAVFETDKIDHPEYIFPPATPEYMAPELFAASYQKDITAATDIYSIGVILYEMLHPKCNLPFRGNAKRLCTLHRHATVRPVPEVDGRLMNVIYKCLENDPRCRFQDVDELLAEIESFLSKTLLASILNGSDKSPQSEEKLTQKALRFQDFVQNGISELKLSHWEKARDHFCNAAAMNIKDNAAGRLSEIIDLIIRTSMQKARQVSSLMKSQQRQQAIEILEDSSDRITEICQSVQGEKNDTCA